MAYIGDEAYCPECDSVGQIIGGAGVSEMYRLLDMVNGGRRQAVGGDMLLCKCPERPRVIARYGRSWIIHDRGDTQKQLAHADAPISDAYDQHFVLKDERTGRLLADMPYKIVTEDGFELEGRTDSQGRTSKISNDQPITATIHVFEETPPLNPDWDKNQ